MHMSFADLKRNKDTISKLLDAANASGGGEKKSEISGGGRGGTNRTRLACDERE